MPVYQATDPKTGRKVKLTGDSPPTEPELEEIFSRLEPKTEEEKLNFVTRVGNDLKKRADMSTMIAQSVTDGEQSFAEGMLQIAGKVGAGSVMDFMGEVLVSGGRGLSAITPDIIEKPLIDGATSAGLAFLDTDAGKAGLNAAKSGMESWEAFKTQNPRSARNIEAVVDIGLLAAPVKAKPPSGITMAGKTAAKLDVKAAAQTVAQKKSFVDDLITPKQTKVVKEAQVGRTTEVGGILNSKQVELSAREKAIAETVSSVPEVTPKKTLQGNYSVIAKEIENEAERLKSALMKNDVPITRKELLESGNKVKASLAENPLIVGDAEKVAEKILAKMDQLVKKNRPTASGLLQARKELDQWVKSQKGANIFDPKNENAVSIALREIRESANDMVSQKSPAAGVKESLKRQSNLYGALDNIGPKAAEEAKNAALRLWQQVTKIVPLRGEFNQSMAILFGVGGLGAAATFAPFFTNLAVGLPAAYFAGKAVTSAGAKRGLALLLRQTDKAIRATKDANVIKELRADRALIVELLKEPD